MQEAESKYLSSSADEKPQAEIHPPSEEDVEKNEHWFVAQSESDRKNYERAFADCPSGQTGQLLYEGRVLRGRKFEEYCERNGTCKKGGKVRIKE